jgi:hypothetical protein
MYVRTRDYYLANGVKHTAFTVAECYQNEDKKIIQRFIKYLAVFPSIQNNFFRQLETKLNELKLSRTEKAKVERSLSRALVKLDLE